MSWKAQNHGPRSWQMQLLQVPVWLRSQRRPEPLGQTSTWDESDMDEFLRVQGLPTFSSPSSPEPVRSPEPVVPLPTVSAWSWIKSLILFGGALMSFSVCAMGWATLFFLLVPHFFAPSTAYQARELYFDYTLPAAVAEVSMLPDRVPTTKASKPPAAFPECCSLDVWLTMEIPSSSDGNVFQVKGELFSESGRLLASVSKPVVTQYRSPIVQFLRDCMLAPFVVMGFTHELQQIRVPLFLGYMDKDSAPFTHFRATLQARASRGELPVLYAANVHVGVRLGVIRRILYVAQLPTFLTIVLGSLAAVAVAGGGLTGIVLALVGLLVLPWLQHSSPRARRPGPMRMQPLKEEDTISDVSSASDVSSVGVGPSEMDEFSAWRSPPAGGDEASTEPWPAPQSISSNGLPPWGPGLSLGSDHSGVSGSAASDGKPGFGSLVLSEEVLRQQQALQRAKTLTGSSRRRLSSMSSRKDRAFGD